MLFAYESTTVLPVWLDLCFFFSGSSYGARDWTEPTVFVLLSFVTTNPCCRANLYQTTMILCEPQSGRRRADLYQSRDREGCPLLERDLAGMTLLPSMSRLLSFLILLVDLHFQISHSLEREGELILDEVDFFFGCVPKNADPPAKECKQGMSHFVLEASTSVGPSQAAYHEALNNLSRNNNIATTHPVGSQIQTGSHIMPYLVRINRDLYLFKRLPARRPNRRRTEGCVRWSQQQLFS